MKILKHIEMLTVLIKLLNDKCALTDVLLAISFSSFLEIRRTSSSQPIVTLLQSVTKRKTSNVTNNSLWWIYPGLEPEWQIVITGENVTTKAVTNKVNSPPKLKVKLLNQFITLSYSSHNHNNSKCIRLVSCNLCNTDTKVKQARPTFPMTWTPDSFKYFSSNLFSLKGGKY